jgi:uncharacterized protein
MSIASDKLIDYLASDPLFKQVYDYTKQRFDAAPHLTAHNFEHAYRDVINAILIGESEGADMSIVLPAAVMHDIGFLYGATGKTHGAVGADKLAEYLAEGHLSVPVEKLKAIADCIRTHKGSMHGENPETIEAKVVADADLLEKIGPIGVYQNIRTFGEFGLTADEVINRLKKLDSLTFSTTSGNLLAARIQGFATEFAKSLDQAYSTYRSESEESK